MLAKFVPASYKRWQNDEAVTLQYFLYVQSLPTDAPLPPMYVPAAQYLAFQDQDDANMANGQWQTGAFQFRETDTDTDTQRKLQEKLAQKKVRSVAGLPKDSKLNAHSPLTADALGPSIVSLNTNKSSSSSSSSSSHAPRALTRRIFVSDRLLDGVCTGVH